MDLRIENAALLVDSLVEVFAFACAVKCIIVSPDAPDSFWSFMRDEVFSRAWLDNVGEEAAEVKWG